MLSLSSSKVSFLICTMMSLPSCTWKIGFRSLLLRSLIAAPAGVVLNAPAGRLIIIAALLLAVPSVCAW